MKQKRIRKYVYLGHTTFLGEQFQNAFGRLFDQLQTFRVVFVLDVRVLNLVFLVLEQDEEI